MNIELSAGTIELQIDGGSIRVDVDDQHGTTTVYLSPSDCAKLAQYLAGASACLPG